MNTKPNARPISGETASAIRTPKTPTGRQPFRPPHRTAPSPPSTSAAPTRPPTSACAELDGNPRDQVRRFQSTAASAPEPITTTASAPETVTIPAIVSATAVPTRSAPSMLKTAESTTACRGRGTTRGDERRDRIRGVVEAVRQRERERKRDRQPQSHRSIIRCLTTRDALEHGRRREPPGARTSPVRRRQAQLPHRRRALRGNTRPGRRHLLLARPEE